MGRLNDLAGKLAGNIATMQTTVTAAKHYVKKKTTNSEADYKYVIEMIGIHMKQRIQDWTEDQMHEWLSFNNNGPLVGIKPHNWAQVRQGVKCSNCGITGRMGKDGNVELDKPYQNHQEFMWCDTAKARNNHTILNVMGPDKAATMQSTPDIYRHHIMNMFA